MKDKNKKIWIVLDNISELYKIRNDREYLEKESYNLYTYKGAEAMVHEMVREDGDYTRNTLIMKCSDKNYLDDRWETHE